MVAMATIMVVAIPLFPPTPTSANVISTSASISHTLTSNTSASTSAVASIISAVAALKVTQEVTAKVNDIAVLICRKKRHTPTRLKPFR
ncbi:hypothetical protein F5876DRAFT_75459 [Lentinula aff. lateritia]|uniref:Uncharacterized protein n=1 Tax=Lentinula aff. lateritia TaxID=2804960 RepID=A0ACC1U4Q5_9AGAR|nr:hypothetical protein F5876DRAFT_75459 [Lentinula aff. lateritia]